MKEDAYDAVIAPKLAEVAAICKEAGVAFHAIVEYEPGHFGSTIVTTNAPRSHAMVLVECADKAQGNIDALAMAFARYCDRNGINTRGSFVLSPHR